MNEQYALFPNLFAMLQQEVHFEQIDHYMLPSEIAMNWQEYLDSCEENEITA